MIAGARILLSFLPREVSKFISGILQTDGYQVKIIDGESEFKSTLGHESFNMILTGPATCSESGCDMLSYVKQRYPATIVVIISEDTQLETAVDCMKRGAYDYLIPPLEQAHLIDLVQHCLDRQRLGLRRKEITRSLEEKVIHLQQLNQRMSALYKIIRDARGMATLEDSLQKVLEYLGEAVDLEGSYCILMDEDFGKLVIDLKHGREFDLCYALREILLDPGENTRYAFAKGRNINEVSLEVERDLLRRGIAPERFQSFIICPLIILKNLYGYLCLVNDLDRPAYSFADRQMLSIVASQAVAICEENHSLMQSSQLITMGNLTSELAHDLKNPLANIKGILQTMDGKWSKDSVRDEALQMIFEELSRADNLAVELLAFAKNQELEIRYWNVHELLQKSLTITRNTLAQGKIEVGEQLYSEPLMVWANENELVDAFVNIIVNAAQAMTEGGQLTLGTRVNYHQGMTSRGMPARGRYVQIEITDTGHGMTRWEMDRIFERFYTTKNSGTGLGLSIVDRVIKKYQGFIDVKSVKDEGTSFYLNLPQR